MAKSRNRKLADLIVTAGVDIAGNVTFDGGSTSADLTFADNDKANFGASSDLQVYHDGGNSYIKESGSGSLVLQSAGPAIVLEKTDGENMLLANTDGAITLYYNGSTKLATTSTGINVTGITTSDTLVLEGTGVNTTYFTGGDASVSGRQLTLSSEAAGGQNNATHRLTVPSGYGSFNITVNAKERVKINNNGDVSFYNDASSNAVKMFWDASAESLGLGTTTPSSFVESSRFVVGSGTSGTNEMMFLYSGTNTFGAIGFADGTSGTARYKGIIGYHHTGDELFFSTNGGGEADRDVTITSVGNVGIGTGSPGAIRLNVTTPTANHVAAQIENSNTADSFGLIVKAGNDANDYIADFRKRDNTNIMRIRGDGNVGIGTSSPALSLHVVGAVRVDNNEGVATRKIRSNYFSNGQNLTLASGTSANIIMETAKVGIGESSPTHKLHVSSTARFELTNGGLVITKTSGGASTNSDYMSALMRTDTAGYHVTTNNGGFASTANALALMNHGDLILATAPATGSSSNYPTGRVMILAGGNVGVGTAAPTQRLHVDGVIVSQNSGQGAGQLQLQGYGNSAYINHNGSGDLIFRMGSGFLERMRLQQDGILHVTSGATAIVPTIKHSGATGQLAKLRVINRNGQGADKGGLLELGGVTNDEVSRSDVFASVAGLKRNSNSNVRTGYLQFSVTNGSSLQERARITDDGKFGLGTSDPQKYLHMQHGSTNAFTPSNDSWHSVIVHNNASATTNTAGIAFEVSGNAYHGNAGTGIAAVKNGTNSDYGADLVFITRPQSAVAAERMRIDSSGNVGIGTTNPYYTLDLRGSNLANGAAKNLALIFDKSSATMGTGGGIAFGGYSNGTSGDINHFGNIQGIKENGTAGNYASAMIFTTRANGALPVEQMRIASNGDVTFAESITTAGNITSSGRLKGTEYRVQEGSALAGGMFKEKAVTGTGTSNDLAFFAESISNGGDIHFMTGGTTAKRLSISSDGYVSLNRGANEYGLELKSAGTRSGLVLKKPGTDTIQGSLLMLADESLRLGTASVYNIQMYQNGNVIMPNGKVGIGTTNPSSLLELRKTTAGNITGGTGNTGAVLTLHHEAQWENGYTGGDWLGAIDFSTGDASVGEGVRASIRTTVNNYYNTHALAFYTADQGDTTLDERMRITHEGNLLVGKIALDNSTVGIRMNATGDASFCADGARPLVLNRKTSDGELLVMLKDNTHFGSISTWGGNPAIGRLNCALLFNDDINRIIPASVQSNTVRDNVIDLGDPSHRFNDVWIGGGIHLGGTGNANKLNDYEEGTWTPNLTDSSANSVTQSAQTGHYTKIGNMVYVYFAIQVSSTTGAGNGLQIRNLPFSVANVSYGGGEPSGGTLTFVNNLQSRDLGGGIILRANNATSYIEMKYTPGGAQTTIGGTNWNCSDISSSTYMTGSCWYAV